MTRRHFPRSPEISPRPFDGDRNPFADGISTPISPSDNPLAAPATDEVQPFLAGEYEQTQFDRSARTLSLAVLGALFVAASLLVAIVITIRNSAVSTELVYCFPTNLLGLALSLPAWIMSRADWRAMEAGVLEPSAARRTRIAWWCSCPATLFGTIPFLGVLVAIGGSIFA